MIEEDLPPIEAALGVVIPPALRRLLTESLDRYPDLKFDRYSSDQIIAANRKLAADGMGGKLWHQRLLALGTDQAGYTYFIDLEDSKPWLYSASGQRDPAYRPETYKEDCRFALLI